jgi:hypothetical protein
LRLISIYLFIEMRVLFFFLGFLLSFFRFLLFFGGGRGGRGGLWGVEGRVGLVFGVVFMLELYQCSLWVYLTYLIQIQTQCDDSLFFWFVLMYCTRSMYVSQFILIQCFDSMIPV